MALPESLPRPETSVELCERALRAAILGGELAPGERLPPERELALRLGVTRVTLRAALARLASARLIRSRQGSGHVVADFLRDGGPELLQGLVTGREPAAVLAAHARELLRVRRHLARAILEALAERAAAEPASIDAAGVARAVDGFARAAEGAPPVGAPARPAFELRMAEADLAVMDAILAATGSPVLRLCLNPIAAVLREVPALRAALYVDPARNLAGWRGLVAWLEAPDPAAIEMLVAVLEQGDRETHDRLAARAAAEAPGGAP